LMPAVCSIKQKVCFYYSPLANLFFYIGFIKSAIRVQSIP
jgi:hypothetical protein